MRIAATSDLHGNLPEIPECDILIIAGDVCPHTHRIDQMYWLHHEFSDWLDSTPARHKVYIAGNHDYGFTVSGFDKSKIDAHYLLDSGVEVEGLNIWGSPYTPTFCDWAFMQRDAALANKWAKIPENTDILITHGPPKFILDKCMDGCNAGSDTLSKHIYNHEPKLHIFGHIHEGYGQDHFCYNVSHVDFNYEPVNPIVEIDL